MRDALEFIGIWLFIIGVIALLVVSGDYNNDSQKTCESVGQTMVKDYNTGQFGCANVTPFDEVAKR